jgi:serine/threonine-protein kinase
VPPAREFNSDVPRSLDQVLAHALARDPATRYQTAREFGRDLNRILFELGRPVSSFDLAGFVSDVLHEKSRQRSIRPKQQTLIGSLIADAIMSFTSLKNKSNSGSGDKSLSPQVSPDEESGVGAIPLSIGSFDPAWEERSRTEQKEPSHVGLAPPSYPIGDLASQLEDLDENPSGSVNLNALMTSRSAQPMTAPPNRQPRNSAAPPPSRRMTPGAQSYPGGVPQSYEHPHAGVQFHPANTHAVPLRFWIACALIVLIGGTLGAYMAGVFN